MKFWKLQRKELQTQKVKVKDKVLDGVTSDLSLSGMQLRVRDNLPQDEPLHLALTPPVDDRNRYAQQTPLELTGRISRHRESEGSHYYGIEFIGLSQSDNTRLKTCFEFFHHQAEYASAAWVDSCAEQPHSVSFDRVLRHFSLLR